MQLFATLDCVWHVGTFDLSQKRPTSYEAKNLSVSWCPEAWTRIARLGGNPSWRIDLRDARFLDVLNLSAAARAAIIDDFIRRGFLERCTTWRVQHYDSETDDTRYMEFPSEAEARAEIQEDDGSELISVSSVCATPSLTTLIGARETAIGSLAEDFAFMAWAELHGLAGAWWREAYDPLGLSAPRGCLFASAFDRSARSLDEPDDDDLLERFPEPTKVRIVRAPAGLSST